MHFRQIPPPQELRSYVRFFWSLESEEPILTPRAFGPLADGCPGIMFQPREAGSFFDHDNKELPEVFVYGQSIRRTSIFFSGRFQTLGLSFFPNILKSVFGFDASELTDDCLDLRLLETGLPDQLLHAASVPERIAALSGYLLSCISKTGGYVDAVTQFALSRIIESKGNLSLKELQENMQLSERSFERRFNQFVGVSPKLYARICKFQSTLSQLVRNDYGKLSDIAFDHDYSDQSHFIRTFKEFAGFSPYQLRKQSFDPVGDLPILLK